MAISRDKKSQLVDKLGKLLDSSKLTAFAEYAGLSVADLQELRRAARAAGVTILVVKNRLVKVALQKSDVFKNVDAANLNGQLLYSFSDDDEVAPAGVLADFAAKHPALKLRGGLQAGGALLNESEIKALAALPSKPVLIASVVQQLLSPVDDVVSGLGGNLPGLLDAIAAKAN
ncbi:MAG: 50S ribosomal protein L10 [Candidatus Nomurabacteria bacterium]|jgi:large subunit ribosomal protein L10|nr:50S ribosomal protein L10 [Candidatus Nomurabacteria bacterium]